MDGYSCICSTCIRSSQTPLPSGLPCNIGQTSLHYIVGPYETTKNLPRIKKCPLSDILETTGFKLISKGFFQFKTTAMVTGYLDVCAKFLQSCPTHYNSTDCSQPGSCVHGFFGLPSPSPGELPYSGIKPSFLMSPALAGRFFITSATWETLDYLCWTT